MDNRSAREEPKRWVAGTILGLVMLFTGLMLLISQTRFYIDPEGIDGGTIDTFLAASRVVLIIGGLIIVLKRKEGNYFAVGVYAITLGASRIIRSLPRLFSGNDAIFYANILFLIVGANLVIAGYNHLTVRTRNPILMRYTAIIIVITYLLVHLYCLYARLDLSLIYQYAGDTLAYLPLYIALVFVLFSKELVINAPWGRVRRLAAATAERTSVGDVVSVSEEDGRKLIDGFSDPGWKRRTVGGIGLKEENITLRTKHGNRDVVMSRWEGDPVLYITIVDDGRDSYIAGHRIRAVGYERHDDRIDLLDDMGVCASIMISSEAVQ